MTTNAELIAGARRVVLDHKAVASFRLIDQLADALEASEARVARLRASLREFNIFTSDTPSWPADLLEAVQALCYGADHEHIYDVAMCSLCKARATLVRYGLLEGEAK